ncbi:hypothetical protein [Winogradskyella sp. MIT101101]|uniref:hypothetical protein n=1 Tax=Winogradskyella sp. MIT101101 TaxID=3098297 RepID=UPI003999C80E
MKKFFAFLLVVILFSCNNDDDSMTPVEDPLVVAEFRQNLSELNLFVGDLSELNITSRAFEYSISTPSFADYSKKQRFIALPEGTSLEYNGNGLPIFPERSLIAKTFYYNNDDRDLSLGRKIIETRLLIKVNGEWESGVYKWNDAQTEAVLDLNGSTVPVSWIDQEGNTNATDYLIPENSQCFTCHRSFNELVPLGPKLRNLNFEINGENQLQEIINNQNIEGLSNSTSVSSLPNWQDGSASLEARARAYMDINCAYCHTDGGFCENESTLRMDYETLLENSQIVERKGSISFRISEYNPGISMPFIGTTMIHEEGVDLIQDYLDTL